MSPSDLFGDVGAIPLPWGGTLLFGDPLFLLLLLPLLAFVRWRARARARRGAADGASLHVVGGLPATWRTRTHWLPGALLALGAGVVVVALARPLEGRHQARVVTEGVDIVLVIDRSSSMLESSLDPRVTNFQAVKEAAGAFVRGRPDDRLGLVTFARYARTECPLTLDEDAVLQVLAAVENARPRSEEDGTSIGIALGHAALKLRDSDAKSKVVVLLTDGLEMNAGIVDPSESAALCADLGIKVYTILSVSPYLPAWDVQRAKALLESIAQATGGQAFSVRSADYLELAWDTIDQLERTAREDIRYTDYDDLYPSLMPWALLLLVLGAALARGPYMECTA